MSGHAGDIALVISDVDGTLVTTDKRLSPATVRAVERLGRAGIGFTIASARPPVGLRSLVEGLGLSLPMGAFNGASIVGPDLAVIEEHLIPEPAARAAMNGLAAAGLDVWVFADGKWCLSDPRGPYTDLERRTLQTEPTVVTDLAPLLARASKIVGVSADHGHLAACEGAMAEALGTGAIVHRSQAYYLDVTPPGIDKGGFVAWMARWLDIPEDRVATFGDAGNDRAMFARSGLSIAMGNAQDAVKEAADRVTGSNDADGFATAIEALLTD